MGVSIKGVNMLINVKRDVTAEIAVLLENVLKTAPEFWMNLQAVRDIYIAKRIIERVA